MLRPGLLTGFQRLGTPDFSRFSRRGYLEHCPLATPLGNPLLGGLELADDLLRCVPGAFHGEVPGPVWPDEDSHSAWTGFRGPRQLLVGGRDKSIVIRPLWVMFVDMTNQPADFSSCRLCQSLKDECS